MFKFTRVLLVSVWLLVLLSSAVSVSGAGAGDDSGQWRALMAQPVGLTHAWHTFYGVADSNVNARSVAVDAQGNVYIAGYSNKTWGEPLHDYSGDNDLMVIKLNAQGAYQWHVFYGAAPDSGNDGNDEAAGIAVDSAGNLYVTGYSDRTWQGDGDTDPLNAHGGDADYMFILSLGADGAYRWHTFFQPGRPEAIDVDDSGVYVAGIPSGSWAEHAPLRAFPDGGNNLVALKFNDDGLYQWHTYYGSNQNTPDPTTAFGIVSDAAHNAVYVTGQAPDNWPGGDGSVVPPLHAFSGGDGVSTDIVVVKLNGAGAYQWHTFYGAADVSDLGRDIAVDGAGNLYVAGLSAASWDMPLHAYNAERDITVLKLDGAGAHQWHTFYGSGTYDDGAGIALDGSGNVYVAGTSGAMWLGDGGAEPAHPYAEESLADIVVVKLNANGAFQRHTFYGGGDAHDSGMDVALGLDASVFVTGLSAITWQGDGNAAPLHPHSGNLTGDPYVLKLSDRVYGIYLPLILR
ncbi:MAG: SBBP repeat-containing protein [Anaerolineae bacterium]|nr:SBBP repeat-containing protein [Anaerolineae bacterium]